MSRRNTIPQIVLWLWGISFAIFTYCGIYSLREGIDPNYCDMTLCWPYYVPIAVENSIFNGKYQLFLFREYSLDPINLKDLKTDNIPLLFVGGHAGHYYQARAFGSTLARRRSALQHDNSPHANNRFDVFILHYNEELSAFKGELLLDEAIFFNEAIRKILSLYTPQEGATQPSSVMVVGHSMGGMVARIALTLPDYIPNSVNTLITLGTPHTRPVIAVDRATHQLYKTVNQFWREAFSSILHSPENGYYIEKAASRWRTLPMKKIFSFCRSSSSSSSFPSRFICQYVDQQYRIHTHYNKVLSSFSDLSLISIAGGNRDIMVPSDLSQTSTIAPDAHTLNVLTSSMKNVWLSTGHASLAWCKQLIFAINDMMIDIARKNSPSRTAPLSERMAIAKKYLEPQTSWDYLQSVQIENISMPTDILRVNGFVDVSFTQNISRYSINIPIVSLNNNNNMNDNSKSSPLWKSFHLFTSAQLLDRSLLSPSPLSPSLSIYLCYEQQKCKKINDFAYELPGGQRVALKNASGVTIYSALDMDASLLKDATHIVIERAENIQSTTSDFLILDSIKYDNDSMGASSHTLQRVNLWKLLLGTVNIPVNRPWHLKQAFLFPKRYLLPMTLTVDILSEPTSCPFLPVAHQTTTFSTEEKFIYHPHNSLIVAQDSPSFLKSTHNVPSDHFLSIDLFLHTQCSYRVSFRVAWMAIAAQTLHRYGTGLLAFSQVILLLCCRYQRQQWRMSGHFPSFSHTLWMSRIRQLPRDLFLLFSLNVLRQTLVYDYFHPRGIVSSESLAFSSNNNYSNRSILSIIVTGLQEMLLGPTDASLLRVPFMYLLSVGAALVIAALTQSLVMFTHFMIILVFQCVEYLTALLSMKQFNVIRTRWRNSFKDASFVSHTLTVLLFVIASFVFPYYVVFMGIFIRQLVSTAYAFYSLRHPSHFQHTENEYEKDDKGEKSKRQAEMHTRYHFQWGLLSTWALVLVLNIPMIIIYVNDLRVGTRRIFIRDRNVWLCVPLAMLGGPFIQRTMPLIRFKLENMSHWLECFSIVYLFIYGTLYTYSLRTVCSVCAFCVLVQYAQYPIRLSRSKEPLLQ